MEQAAKIKGLKSVSALHSQVSEAGVKFFEGIRRWSPFRSPR